MYTLATFVLLYRLNLSGFWDLFRNLNREAWRLHHPHLYHISVGITLGLLLGLHLLRPYASDMTNTKKHYSRAIYFRMYSGIYAEWRIVWSGENAQKHIFRFTNQRTGRIVRVRACSYWSQAAYNRTWARVWSIKSFRMPVSSLRFMLVRQPS